MARGLSVGEIVQKQIDRTSAAVTDVIRGVNRVTESPTEKAADNLDKAATAYAEAIRSGKTAQRLRAVSLAEWKDKTVAKADRIPGGIAAAASKLQEFHSQRAAVQDRIDAALKTMPTKTRDQMRSRMNKQFDEMSKFTFEPK